MNRVLEIPISVDIKRISYQQVVTVDLEHVSIVEWCLNLCLLKEGLTNTLTFIGNTTIKIDIDKSIKRSDRAKVHVAPKQIHLSVHPEEFDYWLSFFLKYESYKLAPSRRSRR